METGAFGQLASDEGKVFLSRDALGFLGDRGVSERGDSMARAHTVEEAFGPASGGHQGETRALCSDHWISVGALLGGSLACNRARRDGARIGMRFQWLGGDCQRRSIGGSFNRRPAVVQSAAHWANGWCGAGTSASTGKSAFTGYVS